MDELLSLIAKALVISLGAVFAAFGLGMLHVPVSFFPRLIGSDAVLWGVCIASLVNRDDR